MNVRRTGAIIAATLLAMFCLLAVKSGGQVRAAAAMTMHATDSGAGRTVVVDGPAIALTHGLIQVQATVVNGRITDVKALQIPHDNPHSYEFSLAALPKLRSEALSSQSAAIQVVSGATFTSRGYAQSLQAALDKAGI